MQQKQVEMSSSSFVAITVLVLIQSMQRERESVKATNTERKKSKVSIFLHYDINTKYETTQGKEKKTLHYVSVVWIIALGKQIKVWLNICGVSHPPLTNTGAQLVFAFKAFLIKYTTLSRQWKMVWKLCN